MIVFDQLGKNLGRLGNNLFQIAATLTHAHRVGDQPAFNRWEFQDCFAKALPELSPEETGKLIINGVQHEMVHHTQFHYEPLPDRKNLYMLGFFQSEKYFKPEVIKPYFTPSAMQEAKVNEASKKIFGVSSPPHGTVAIHIRRGDYALSNGFHPILPLEYYKASFSKLFTKTHISLYCKPHSVLIFSDDIPFCKENFKQFTWFAPNVNVYFSEGNDAPTDLFLAARCSYFIIANSALSWWMAYFAKLLYLPSNNIVFAPKQWFGGENAISQYGERANHNTKDLYCKEWILVNNQN